MELHDGSCFELDFAQGRLAVLAGAFVEKAVVVEQPLGEGCGVVGEGADDSVGIRGDFSGFLRLEGSRFSAFVRRGLDNWPGLPRARRWLVDCIFADHVG